MKIAIFPGTFYPFHQGHIAIIKRAAKLFDKLYVVASVNLAKNNLDTLQTRCEIIQKELAKYNLTNVIVTYNDDLTINFAKKNHCQYIVRSIRNSQDFDTEYNMAQANYYLNENIETIFFLAEENLKNISSSTILEIAKTKDKLNG